mgnify:CR=1 FL=1
MNNVTTNNEAQKLTAFEIGALLQKTDTDIDTIHMIVKRIIDAEKALKNAENWAGFLSEKAIEHNKLQSNK